jgi:hypothetical protein
MRSCPFELPFLAVLLCGGLPAAEPTQAANWTRLFNGTNLGGWYTVVRNAKSEDRSHFVQIEDGMIHEEFKE